MIEEEIMETIRDFTKPRGWEFGLRNKYLFQNLIHKYSKEEIITALTLMESSKQIYKIWKSYNKLYWYLRKEYRVNNERRKSYAR